MQFYCDIKHCSPLSCECSEDIAIAWVGSDLARITCVKSCPRRGTRAQGAIK